MSEAVLTELSAKLITGSLSDEDLLAGTGSSVPVHILPDANVVKIGGQSLIDRGRAAAVFPVIEELVANLPDYKLIIGCGAGTQGPGKVVR